MYDVRPLTSFAVKSIGDTLRPYFSKAHVLDLFAGLGSFSEIALKEGCASALAIENNKNTYHELKQTLSKNDSFTARCQDVFSFLELPTQKFDLVFADPPYPLWSDDFQKKFFPLILGTLEKNGIFLVRHPKKVILLNQFLKIPQWKEKVIGESKVTYFRYAE